MADLEAKCDNNSSKKSKNNSSQTLTLSLPDHILFEEILARLPVKSLIRSKSVCKYWLFIISSRKFEAFHLKFSYLRRQFLLLPYSDEFGAKNNCNDFFFSLSYNECSNVKDLVGLGCGGIEEFPIIVGSCNGLLCLIDKEEYAGKFIIWNPAIDDYREITNPKNILDVLAYGFGYDSLDDDYKIAASFGTRTKKFRGFYVYSIREGDWKKIVGKYDMHVLPIAAKLDSGALLIDNTLYWPPRQARRTGQYFKAKHIVGFNLVSEKFKDIPWPNDLRQYCKVDLFQFKGNLTFRGCENYQCEVWDFWMLKKVDKTDTWEKLFTVDLTNVLFYNFSKTDKCLVRHFEHLKLIDPCKEALEQVRGENDYTHVAKTDDYVESLVSPFATTKIDEEDENYETAIVPIMDNIHRKILLNKRVPVSKIQVKKSDYEDEDEDDYGCCESDIEGDDGCESDYEDDNDGCESDYEDDFDGCESDYEDDSDGCESDLEDYSDGSRSDLEDDGKVSKYWISSDDDDKDSDYFKYATSNDEDEDDDYDDDD